MKNQVAAVLTAVFLSLSFLAEPAAASSAAESETEPAQMSETETAGTDTAGDPVNPETAGITAEDAAVAGRTLYSQMKHYAEVTDNVRFASCFETDMSAAQLQRQLADVQAADKATQNLSQHADYCYFDPTRDRTQTPYSFGVGLTDYEVQDDGTVEWYSILLRVAKYGDAWKASSLPDGNLFDSLYPEGYEQALGAGRNAVDLYPYLALRFSESGVFTGAFYSLVNMAWQNSDGSMSAALWIANGQEGTKWCDSIDLIFEDGDKSVASVNAPVQQSVEGGESVLVTVNIPAENVRTGTDAWSSLTVQSNLLYQ